MQKINKHLILLLLTLFLITSCKKKDKLDYKESEINTDTILKKSISIFKTLHFDNIDSLKFKRKSYILGNLGDNNEDVYYYEASKDNKNTVVFFEIYVRSKKKYSLNNYIKTFSDSSNFHFIKKNNDVDTLYYFKIGRRILGVKNFVIGKYNYFNEKNIFTTKEDKIFLKYKDSLKKVKGNIKLFKGLLDK